MTKRLLDKAVILARGLGTRMRRPDDTPLDPRQQAAAASGVKAMMPVGRPFLDYVLTSLAASGYGRVCLVVAPEHETVRRYYFEQAPCHRLELELAVQPEPDGTADAVLAAETFAGDDPFLVINSDNYYPVEALTGLRSQDGSAAALFARRSMIAGSNVPAERLARFAVARIDERGLLSEILEKPDPAALSAMPEPIWISMNCWRFERSIFDACRRVVPSPRGELEIPDAVALAIDQLGVAFHAVPVEGAVLDLTGRADVAPVAARLENVEVDY